LGRGAVKILVCVKQVPDAESVLTIDRRGRWIADQDRTVFRMNRLDEFAIEEALRIKERFSDTTDVCIDSVSVGPPRVRAMAARPLSPHYPKASR